MKPSIKKLHAELADIMEKRDEKHQEYKNAMKKAAHVFGVHPMRIKVREYDAAIRVKLAEIKSVSA